MAVNLSQLFSRLGKLGQLLYTVHGPQANLSVMFADLYSTFGAAYPALDGSVAQQQDAAVRSLTPWWGTAAAAFQQLLFQTVKADNPAAARTVPEALAELRRQMLAAGATVPQCTVTATPAALSGSVGDGAVVLSTLRGDGLPQEHAAPEVARLVCTADSYTGGATQGREQFLFVGRSQDAGTYDSDWPTGSGAQAGLAAVSADDAGGTTTNLLTNGNLDTWTGTPLQLSNWAVDVGAWATDVVRSATAYRGAYSARFVAGSTLSVLYTQFGSSAADGATAGTPVTPDALRSYAVCFRARTVSGTASGGVFTVELTDDAGTVTADAQGTNNSFTLTASTLTTSWSVVKGVFRLPAAPPATLRLRIRVSTALAGADVLIDDVVFTPLVGAYAGGPGVAVVSGATPFVAGDGWAVTVGNDYAGNDGAIYGDCWQHLFLRVFLDPAYLLPSSLSPTIGDNLITG